MNIAYGLPLGDEGLLTNMRAREFARYLRKNMTKAEIVLWQALRKRSINGRKFLRQYPIQHFKSEEFEHHFIADFYCHELKLIIEVDGDIHLVQKEYDKQRDSTLNNLGYKVIRFTNDQVLNNLTYVIKKIEVLTHPS